MAIERFTWATEKGAEGDVTQRVRTKQFGDGYEQSVEEGLNNQSQSWPLTFTGAAWALSGPTATSASVSR
mgnify:CR=1 FL=1